MKLRNTFVIFIMTLAGMAHGQTMSNTADDMKTPITRGQLGLKLGASLNSWTGGEIPNPEIGLGYTAGFVYAAKETDKGKLGFQTELNIKFVRYPFGNESQGASSLTQISVNQFEVPLLGAYALSSPKMSKKYNVILAGLAPSFTFSSRAFVGSEKTPLQKNNYFESWKSLPLTPMGISAVVGYQSRSAVVGWQVMLKYTINDLNNNFSVPGTLPATGNGRPIRFLNLEAALVF